MKRTVLVPIVSIFWTLTLISGHAAEPSPASLPADTIPAPGPAVPVAADTLAAAPVGSYETLPAAEEPKPMSLEACMRYAVEHSPAVRRQGLHQPQLPAGLHRIGRRTRSGRKRCGRRLDQLRPFGRPGDQQPIPMSRISTTPTRSPDRCPFLRVSPASTRYAPPASCACKESRSCSWPATRSP